MIGLTKYINQNKEPFEELVTGRVSVPVLERTVDYILYEGAESMKSLMHNAPEDKDKISAFKAIISLGRYIEVKKVNSRKIDNEIEFDDNEFEVL